MNFGYLPQSYGLFSFISFNFSFLKIAVNTRLLLPNRLEGIGWFTFENLSRIVASNPQHEFYFFFDRQPDPKFIFAENVKAVVLKPPARHPFLFIVWFEWSVTRALKKIKPDIFLSPDGYLSLHTKVPSIAVFHDLNFEHFPKDIPKLVRWHYCYFFPRFARKAARIATVSEYSKQDIVEQYAIDPAKIDVVYNGANERFTPVSEEVQAQIREEYTQGAPYFLFVGALHPRKNLVRLFQAFDRYKEKTGSKVKLLIVGEKMFRTQSIEKTYDAMKYRDEVVFCGRVSNDALYKIMASALALTYVSYFEGFGIPIVEAFRSATAVITSNCTSMPEVAGDAALLCDPYNVDSIAEAMEQITYDDKLREELIKKGLERSRIFSWDAAAERLWNTVERTLEQSKNKR